VQLDAEPLDVATVNLPIGISFFTFQAMSYVIDVYRGEGKPQRNPINFALYIAMFPQLIAGPIVRYRDIAAQLIERRVTLEGFSEGVRRFVLGLGKKMLIANTVAQVSDQIFAVPTDQLTLGMAWLAVVCYTAQIYFDFSGYSDMAIGLGRMFGFRFLENFNYPYIARTITEFWRRWHISLSSWFRDYLYIPLGGGRVSAPKIYRNLVVVFLLCGLWHGASWSFVVWGLFHGAFLVIERIGLRVWLERRGVLLRHVYTLMVVMVGWVFFRAETLGSAVSFLAAMAGLGTGSGLEYHAGLYLDATVVTALAAALVGSMPWMPALSAWFEARTRPAWLEAGVALGSYAGLIVVLLGCSALMAAGTHNPFIYFRF
jgi:alginate O-acetyltransferase complex protein AlgI